MIRSHKSLRKTLAHSALLIIFISCPRLKASPQRDCSELTHSLDGKVFSPEILRLDSASGRIELPGHNAYAKNEFPDIVSHILERKPEDQAKLDAELREELGKREMSFSVKNKATGRYDKIFKVPVRGMPITMSQGYYNKLVHSTAPIMRSIRELSQNIFSNKELTPTSLGIEALPAREQQQVVDIIKNSIYYEKELVHPNMKDYPFFSVVGFDAALGKIDEVLGKFFEFNSGTPSGLSNNIQMLEVIRLKQPELYEKLRTYLKKDTTFDILRETMEDNALAWTGNKEGISVVIGPGIYNGAHPDVASIAHFSNMPLVRANDLYTDKAGHVRLNTQSDGKNDPIVTGIYGRVEESFFLQDSKKGIAWKIPDLEDNPALGKKWGVKLDAGVAYQFMYDTKGEKIGVFKDSKGKPMLAEAWDTIGSDPTRPNAARGSFADAIKNKQLYFSGLGGRVVDDKRLFEYASKYLAPKYADAGQLIASPPGTLRAADLHGISSARKKKIFEAQKKYVEDLEAWNKTWNEGNTAGAPPAPRIDVPELRKDEYQNFFKRPELYVVKAPDGSGGAGIDIMPILSKEERAAVVKKVMADVESGSYRLSIQEFAEPLLLPAAEQDTRGKWRYGTLANDLRLFVFQDSKGNVRAGDQSFLLRVANPGSGSTNTSQGAGYGINIVLDKKAAQTGHGLKKGESVLPLPTKDSPKLPLASSSIGAISDYTRAYSKALDYLDNRKGHALRSSPLLNEIIMGHRDLIPIIGTEHSHIISDIRAFQEGNMKVDDFNKILHSFSEKLQTQESSYKNGTEHFIAGFQSTKGLSFSKGPTIGLPANRQRVEALVPYTPLKKAQLVRKSFDGGNHLDKFEVAVYKTSQDPTVKSALREIEEAGGEIRAIRHRLSGSNNWLEGAPSPYFRMNESGKPIIGIDFSQSHSLAALAHEMEHFRMWKEFKNQALEKGMKDSAASIDANKKLNLASNKYLGEKRSLAAEMKIETTVDSELNKGLELPPREIDDYGYINRMSYPRIEAIREALFQEKIGNRKNASKKILDEHFQALVKESETLRTQAIASIKAQLAKGVGDSKANILKRKLAYFENRFLFEQVFSPYDQARFRDLDLFENLHEQFARYDRLNQNVQQSQ